VQKRVEAAKADQTAVEIVSFSGTVAEATTGFAAIDEATSTVTMADFIRTITATFTGETSFTDRTGTFTVVIRISKVETATRVAISREAILSTAGSHCDSKT